MASTSLFREISGKKNLFCFLTDRSVGFPRTIRRLTLGCNQPIETSSLPFKIAPLSDMTKEETSPICYLKNIQQQKKFCQLD